MLALIAGTGDLPPALVARLPEPPLICAMDGFEPALAPDIRFRIEHLGSFIAVLVDRGVTDICMAGAVRRPEIDPSAIDAQTAPLVPALMRAIAQGDDGALRGVIAIFEDAGLSVRAAHQIAPELLPSSGVRTTTNITPATHQDALLAETTLSEMGRRDTGQACIVGSGRVLAREDRAGTDAMIQRLAPSPDPLWAPVDGIGNMIGAAAGWLSGPDGTPVDAAGAILFKGPKPDQDRRADLPVIGPDTARAAAAAGLSGIVIEASGVMVLDLPTVLDVLNDAGLFLWVRPRGTA